MKKILFLISVTLAMSFILPDKVNAQATFDQSATNPTGAITNAGIDTMTIRLTHGYSRILIGMTYVRATGTGAGTAILDYKVRSTDNYKSDAGDTLTVANSASQTLYWNKTNTARYWRLRVGGGTTVTGTVSTGLQTD